MKRLGTLVAAVAAAALLMPTAAMGQKDKVVEKIIATAQTDNRTMEYDDFLSNVIGGRIVGSHNLEDAEKWVAELFKSWGLEVMVQEVGEIGVGFSRGPWFGRMLSEDGMQLHFVTPSYSAGTKGPQRGHVVLEPKSERQLERMKGVLKGAWVLTDDNTGGSAINLADTAHFYKEMIEAGALGFIQSAKVPLQALSNRKHCHEFTMETLPKACDIRLDERQFAVIKKKVECRDVFELEFDIRNHFFKGPVKYNNIIGIMRGSKYPDQYVLTGGHLDSYDAGTGSVDDANGVSVTLETARLLAASGAKPKRTIMFCIWTAEESGLLGSKHFVQSKTIPLENISNYFNRDGGPTVATSVTVPQAMKADFDKVCKPLIGLSETFPFEVKVLEQPRERPRKGGGSDHAYFAMNGVPVIGLDLTDPLGYNFDYREIWHTERDLYFKVIPEYLNHSSLVNAVIIYGLSNLDHILSREGCYKD